MKRWAVGLGIVLTAWVGVAQSNRRAWSAPEAHCVIRDPAVTESSGLGASRRSAGVLYTHNDSGDSARFFRFDSSGRMTGEFVLRGARARDWEDMEVARVGNRNFIYLADIGDNAERRESVTIHRVEEPEPSGGGRTLWRYESVHAAYPDKPHNAEAFLVDPATGDGYIVTKANSGRCVVFRLAGDAVGEARLQRVGVIALDPGQPMLGRLVTGGSVSPDGRFVVLRTYTAAYEFAVPRRFSDWWKSTPQRIALAPELQGEAIAYASDGRSLLTTSEGSPCRVSIVRLR